MTIDEERTDLIDAILKMRDEGRSLNDAWAQLFLRLPIDFSYPEFEATYRDGK